MVAEWISYSDALRLTEGKPRHLLLGNGFSISVHPGFAYGRLFDEASRIDPGIVELFRGNEPDFEKAISATDDPEEANKLRASFISAVSQVHPKRKYLDVGVRDACGSFLEPFAGRHSRKKLPGSVFTTNYDLLLYWVLMANHQRLNLYDGFDHDGVWDDARVQKSTLFYLHGALHHFEQPFGYVRPKMEQRKLLWREDASLVVQVRDNLARGFFPVFVSEGDAGSKVLRIRRNRYLRKVEEQFARKCAGPDAALFTLGHSLSEVDAHITDIIGRGEAEIFLGIYRPFDDGSRAQRLVAGWAEQRLHRGRKPLQVWLFDSSECRIWTE